jgi:hypothetical protein
MRIDRGAPDKDTLLLLSKYNIRKKGEEEEEETFLSIISLFFFVSIRRFLLLLCLCLSAVSPVCFYMDISAGTPFKRNRANRPNVQLGLTRLFFLQ